MKEGWRCPVCGAVNAPWMPQCSCKGRVAFVSWPTYSEDDLVKMAKRVVESVDEWADRECEAIDERTQRP